MNIESKRIIRVLIGLCILFISLIVYLSYFEIFSAAKVESNSYNKRQWLNEESVIRGKILDRNGNVLVYSEKKDDNQIRYYKYGSLYSHIIGYSYKEYGKSGLEATYNNELLDLSDLNPINDIKNIISDKETNGNNIMITIDHDVQKYASNLLNGRKGSIVMMNPKTGEIYTMISYPSFNPSTLKDDWEEIIEDTNSPLLNRATMGMYTPGSIFKVITATAALQHENIQTEYKCKGSVNIDGYILSDYKGEAHGDVDLEKALAESCNVAFSQIGLFLGQERLRDAAEDYYINKLIPFDLKTSRSLFSTKNMTKADLGATAIGQGKTLVTPLNMAMVASAIANDGEMIKPVLVKEVIAGNGKVIKQNKTEVLTKTSSTEISNKIKDMMVKVVDEGTGKNARIRNISVAGKTGTAENETGKEHAWFIGFAPADDPEVAIAVILENSGSTGGKVAAPIARDIMIKMLNKLKLY